MAKSKAVFGIYGTRMGVERAVGALKEAGFPNSDVSVLLPENMGSIELGTEKNTKAPEGAAKGASAGAVLGGAFGWLVGLGALAIPGLGPFIAAGPLVAALAGVGVGGAVGGFTGAIIGLGIPEYEARLYEGRLAKGGILVAVHCETSGEIIRAKEVMQSTGAEDISTGGETSARPAEERNARSASV
jgi:hypothetical protein